MNHWTAFIAACAVIVITGCSEPAEVSPASVDPTPSITESEPAEDVMQAEVDSQITIEPQEDEGMAEADEATPEALAASAAPQPVATEREKAESESENPDTDSSLGELATDSETEAIDIDEASSFRMLLPTTAGPVLVDVDLRIGREPLATAFDQRIQAVIDGAAAGDASALTWPRLFKYLADDPQQFGPSSVNASQYANLIRLYDKNRNKRPDHGEVAKFVFRTAGFDGPFRLIGSDYFRVVNRSRSPVFAAIDRNEDNVLQADEVEYAADSLHRLDHNGDQRIDLNEVVSVSGDENPAWKKRRSSRWGEVAMDLTGYIDWKMVAYTLDESVRRGAFGQPQNVIARLDRDGSDSMDREEAMFLQQVKPDAKLRIQYSLNGDPPTIEIVSVSDEIEQLVECTSSGNRCSIGGKSLRLTAQVADVATGPNQIPPEAFAMLDADRDGGLDATEIPKGALREFTFEDLDQDSDGKLTLNEINEGMRPESPIWDVQVRARGAEVPDAAFAWLDQNQDDLLSTREIAAAVERLRSIASAQLTLKPTEIPDAFIVQFGRGAPNQDDRLFSRMQSRSAARRSEINGSWPRWAQSMDSNRDGDISLAEFPGTKIQFDQIDKNHDGFVELSEVR